MGRRELDEFMSELGDAICGNCDHSWPCHRSAWGPDRAAVCAVCGVRAVHWHPPVPPEAA